MNYEIIKIVLSKRSEQEKSKKILLFVIDQAIFPKDIIGLVGEYWSYSESVSRFVPSLICPASNEFYKNPYVCANDSKDLVVYEQKVFDKYNVPCTHLPGITAALEFLKENECELRIITEQKPDLEQGVSTNKNNEFIRSLCREPLSHINFFNELAFQVVKAKKFKRNSVDVAAVLENYPYPLIIRRRSALTVSAMHMRHLSNYAAMYSTLLMYFILPTTVFQRIILCPIMYGEVINTELQFLASIEYIKNWQTPTRNPYSAIFNRANLRPLVVSPFLITIAIMKDLVWEIQYTKIMVNNFFLSGIPKEFLLIMGIPSFFANSCETLACLNIYYSEQKEQKENQQPIIYSKTAKVLLCVSILNSAYLVYDVCSIENNNDYFRTILRLFSFINFGISIPRLLLSSRQTAREINEVCENPRQLIERAGDEEGFRESLCTTITRRVARLSSGILYGAFRYLLHNDPIRGVIAGIAAFNETSILNVIRWSPRMFRRFPIESYPAEQKPVLEIKVEEPEDLNIINANARWA